MSDWNGEGLPPVGTECEVYNTALTFPEWESCKILFVGEFTTVYTSASCKERSSPNIRGRFKPLKSQADIERDAFAAHAINHIFSSQTTRTLDALYDAGYRRYGEVVSLKEALLAADFVLSHTVNLGWLEDHYTITKRTCDKGDV